MQNLSVRRAKLRARTVDHEKLEREATLERSRREAWHDSWGFEGRESKNDKPYFSATLFSYAFFPSKTKFVVFRDLETFFS